MNFDKIRFGEMMTPLIKRFKKEKQSHEDVLSKDQADIYYESLKFMDVVILKAAIASIVDKAIYFPTPEVIKEEIRTIIHSRAKNGTLLLARKGCPQCHDGYVMYERAERDRMKLFVGDCAHCHKGEVSIQPQVVQAADQIFYACEREGESNRYRANLKVQELYEGAFPVYTNDQLKARFNNE
jgi:hypothetical protein